MSRRRYDNGTLVINVVNRHRDQAVETEVEPEDKQFTGPVEISEVNGPDIKAENELRHDGGQNGSAVREGRQKCIALQLSPAFLYDAEDETRLMPSLILLQGPTQLIRLSGIDTAIIAIYFLAGARYRVLSQRADQTPARTSSWPAAR